MSSSTESRTKFLFNMSQDIEALKKSEQEIRQEQKTMQETVNGDIRSSIAEAQKTASEARKMLEELKAEQDSLKARVKALEDRFASSEDNLKEMMRKETQNLEHILSQESKERDQGTWDIFTRKMTAASEDTQQALQAIKAEVNHDVDTKIEEVMKATRKVREGEKNLSTIEKQLTRSEKLIKAAENITGKVDAAQRTADEALSLAKKGGQNAASASSSKPEKPSEDTMNQFAMMEDRINQQLTKLECASQLDHARALDAINKVEQERESLVQAIQQEMQKMRQENARIIAEQVERRLAQELEWRDASRTQQQQPKTKEETGKKSSEESSGADNNDDDKNKQKEEEKPKEKSFVEHFLSGCGLLDIYGAKFAEMGYDSELAIKLMDTADLDTLGITALGHRRIILNAVANLNKK